MTEKHIDVWAGFGRLRRIYYSERGEIYPQPIGEPNGNAARFAPTHLELDRVETEARPAVWLMRWRELDRTAYRDVPDLLLLMRAGETTRAEFEAFIGTVHRMLYNRPASHNLPEDTDGEA